MLYANIFLTFSSLVALLLGSFIFISNRRRPVNRALASLLFSIFLWLLMNLLANLSESPDISLWFARATLIGAGGILPYTFLLFCIIYTHRKNFSIKKGIGLAIPPFLLMATWPTSLNIVSVGPYGRDTVTGPIYFLLIPLILIYFGVGFLLLSRYYLKTRDIREKAQMRYMFIGMSLTVVPALIANAILPAFGNNQAILYAPNSVIIFAIFTSIAIIKHKLLDVRLIVARSIGYALTVITIGVFYAIVVFGVIGHFINTGGVKVIQQVIYVAAAIFLALTLAQIRRFFDKITNRLFYRDSYDPQTFIDQLNTVLVSTIELRPLLQQTAKIIVKNIKAESCTFDIVSLDHGMRRLIGTQLAALSEDELHTIEAEVRAINSPLIFTDSLGDREEKLAKLLLDAGIAAVVSIEGAASDVNAPHNLILLGQKKSGNPYNKQDQRVIGIIADELSIAIQNALRFEEIQKFNETLQQKITDATRELRKTNEKLKALDEAKDEFISMASHQLRTPLTSVKGYVSMVLEGDAGHISKQQRDLLDQAFASSQRMVYLIADLLNVSRLKTGKFVIEAVPTQLADVVETEMAQLKESAKVHNLELTYHKPENFPVLNLDETKTRQVIMNFIDNAIYYTPAGGHINVELSATDKVIEYKVVDDGLGVPKAEQHHLFTKFFRAGNAKKARPDGTGLGLFMAKKVVIAQGGSIIFESQEGKGSIFGFSFPRAALEVKK